jgi:glutamate---cysteine ligase / carboxylate-amine ligase
VAQALREIDAGEPLPDLPGRLIEENMWRAIRYGQDGRLLDLTAPRIEEYPAAEALDRLKAWTGADVTLPALNSAQRQRRMIEAGAGPYEVYAKCVEETRATYETAV